MKIKGIAATADEVAAALMDAPPQELADFLEGIGVRAGMIGGPTAALGPELRRLAREFRDELSETVTIVLSPRRRMS